MRKIILFFMLCIACFSFNCYAQAQDGIYNVLKQYHLNEASGTVAENTGRLSGNATVTNAGIWSTGKFGNGINTTNYVLKGTSNATNQNAVTVAFWFKPTTTISASTDQTLFAGSNSAYDDCLGLNPTSCVGIYFYSHWTPCGVVNGTLCVAPNAYQSCITTINTNYWSANTWYHIAYTTNSTYLCVYVNGAIDKCVAKTNCNQNLAYYVGGGGYALGDRFNGSIDDFHLFDYTLSASEIASLTHENFEVVTNTFNSHSINFTSDGGQPCGYNTSSQYTMCGSTEDRTPSFKFNTYGDSTCKIWNEPKSWTTLNNQSIPDCATTGGTNHTCTYSEALPPGNQTIYISCKSGSNEISNFSLYPANIFNISIVSPIRISQAHANDAIELGITKSSIWPGALIYTFQPVYVRIKNNSQAFGTFDKVAIYGNQRWAFNYRIDNESSVSSASQFYNLSPVFYFWEMANLSYWDIVNSVSAFINSTKN